MYKTAKVVFPYTTKNFSRLIYLIRFTVLRLFIDIYVYSKPTVSHLICRS